MAKYILILFLFVFSRGETSCKRQKALPLDKWDYVLIDSSRTHHDVHTKWAWFGMDFADGTHDGYGDILSGKWFYINPGGDMKNGWKRSVVRDTIDNMFIIDVDNDEYADVIGLTCNKQYWFEATDKMCNSWITHLIGTQGICNHKYSCMGCCRADVFKGGKPEILFTDNPGKVWCFEIPDNPDSFWPVTIITEEGGTEKSIAPADVDGDSDIDLITGFRWEDQKDHFSGVCWLENPGKKTGNWIQHKIGRVNYISDHFAGADLNNDGICEIVVAESRAPELFPGGIWLFTAPDGDINSEDWQKNQIAIQYSTNSLSIADMDNDLDLDLVTGEHKGTCRLQILENDGTANFNIHVIDSLKESHNGALVLDIDGDGDMDITTSGWYNVGDVHLWINRAKY